MFKIRGEIGQGLCLSHSESQRLVPLGIKPTRVLDCRLKYDDWSRRRVILIFPRSGEQIHIGNPVSLTLHRGNDTCAQAQKYLATILDLMRDCWRDSSKKSVLEVISSTGATDLSVRDYHND